MIPLLAASGLVLAACGSNGDPNPMAQQAADPVTPPAAAAAAPAGTATLASATSAAARKAPATKTTKSTSTRAPVIAPAPRSAAAAVHAKAPKSSAKVDTAGKGENAGTASDPRNKSASTGIDGRPTASGSYDNKDQRLGTDLTQVKGAESAAQKAQDRAVYNQKNGATDVGITKDTIRIGSVNMHGMALGNVLVTPQVHGDLAALQAINDRGGVLGRRLQLIDCDDGPGEVSRAKACIKKLVGQDQVFALLTGVDWATASIHDDLKEYHLPYVGAWAYSQTEWQDPFMFPTHMSMIHEAMANAHWVVNTIKPKTYGLICLTSPEMQLACNNVAKIMDASGSKLVKRADVSISEPSMSAYVLAFRAANPEHIIHYVINPATMAKFMVEAAQQGYYPPKGISGNHLAAEVLGSIFGQWPVGRYWTNTTYKLWGPEFMATMDKYARSNRGTNHHIVQAGYTAANIFATAAKAVGPNLTRDKLMAELGNGTVWQSDASMDQRFSYVPSERTGNNWNPDYGQGREFMYEYTSTNTVANPDGTPNGFTPDPNQFVIYTSK
jgi:ABC-type branched-subunit amino acid transport system substrate-binding protein